MSSRDGFQWIQETGLVQGVLSICVISPSSNVKHNGEFTVYDVIVVEAGYTELTATRDATAAGTKVLLLEGQDRIGGRSWSSDINGYPFKTGSTWVTPGQPQVRREI